MERSTSLASKLGDLGLIGIAMFVATALVAATLGAPSLSSQPAASDGPRPSADEEPEESAAPQGRPASDPADDGQRHETDHDQGDQAHEHGDPPQTATPGAEHGGQAHDGQGHDPTLVGGDESANAAGHHEDAEGEHEAHPQGSGGHGQAAGHQGHGEGDDHGGHDESGEGHAGGEHEGHEGGQEHEHDDGGEGHGDHDEGGEGHDHSAMYDGCADDHPETLRLQSEVAYALEHLYPDPATLIAQGYIPYFDAQIPAGLATEGMGHWLNPDYIDNGVELDPTRPESILTDEWYRPIGVMFIENADDQPPTPVYVNDDGTECAPWHPHTDMPARFSWWYYRQVHDGAAYNDGEVAPAEVTPAMMHVWATDHHESVYAHGPPAAEHREGFPPPRPGYDTPATPLDGEVPDPEDPDSYPVGPQETCPHCPEDDNSDDHDDHGDGHSASADDREAREEDDEGVLSGVVGDLSD